MYSRSPADWLKESSISMPMFKMNIKNEKGLRPSLRVDFFAASCTLQKKAYICCTWEREEDLSLCLCTLYPLLEKLGVCNCQVYL